MGPIWLCVPTRPLAIPLGVNQFHVGRTIEHGCMDQATSCRLFQHCEFDFDSAGSGYWCAAQITILFWLWKRFPVTENRVTREVSDAIHFSSFVFWRCFLLFDLFSLREAVGDDVGFLLWFMLRLSCSAGPSSLNKERVVFAGMPLDTLMFSNKPVVFIGYRKSHRLLISC